MTRATKASGITTEADVPKIQVNVRIERPDGTVVESGWQNVAPHSYHSGSVGCEQQFKVAKQGTRHDWFFKLSGWIVGSRKANAITQAPES